ncbi:hypothetical protein BKA80DRAFT_138593 [Phyllosticta citrichinensis]
MDSTACTPVFATPQHSDLSTEAIISIVGVAVTVIIPITGLLLRPILSQLLSKCRVQNTIINEDTDLGQFRCIFDVLGPEPCEDRAWNAASRSQRKPSVAVLTKGGRYESCDTSALMACPHREEDVSGLYHCDGRGCLYCIRNLCPSTHICTTHICRYRENSVHTLPSRVNRHTPNRHFLLRSHLLTPTALRSTRMKYVSRVR